MKKFLVRIWAYNHHAKFEVMAEDSSESVENAILDKIGEKSIKWENLGISYDPRIKRITFEEVIDETRPIQNEKVLGVAVGARVS